MCNKKERKRQAVVFVSSFHPRGGVFCCSWQDGAVCFFYEAGRGGFFFFPRRDGVVVFFFRGGTGRFFFFRGGTGRLFFFPRRDGVTFFFFRRDGTGQCFFFFFEGRDGTVVFGGDNFFGGTGQNRYTVPPKAV